MTTKTLTELLEEFELNQSKVGTKDYNGISYFWNSEYKHTLRNCTKEQRIKIHNQLLTENLPLNGVSDRHYEIIKNINNKLK